jgi:hypothetical protein
VAKLVERPDKGGSRHGLLRKRPFMCSRHPTVWHGRANSRTPTPGGHESVSARS